MGGNGAGVAISKIITASSGLTDLRFSATRCGKEGCMEIASSIGAISKLQRVDLSDNTFGTKASGKLGESLKNHTGLQSLNLRDDGMGVDGFEAFLEALESTIFPELTYLDLSGNDLDEDVMGNLIEWLPKAVPNLERLALDDNDIGSDGAILLTKILPKLKKLTHLSICTAEVTGKGGLLLAR
jgi:Ran GTPase-activating protein (RanGAP) involved in mRNA processing and transport